MSKRSTNLENLLKQKEDIESKIAVLQRTLKGINKSLSKLKVEQQIVDEPSDDSEE